MLALVMWGAVSAWRLAGNAPMSIHGWIAMGIAGVFTALLTGGLISLAFYSARNGYDDDQRF
jgi:succinate dehydrogenase hydrophobic anchor subunit